MKSREFSLDVSTFDVSNYTKSKKITKALNSLSVLFPVGEKFFIQSVRRFEKDLPRHLVEDCKVFYQQEAKHSREHNKLNKLLEAQGLDLKKIEAEALERLHRIGSTPKRALLTTVVLEILTDVLAKAEPILSAIAFDDNSACEMWEWHAKEEKEHAHVAAEVLEEIYGYKKREVLVFALSNMHEFAVQVIKNYRRIK